MVTGQVCVRGTLAQSARVGLSEVCGTHRAGSSPH